VIRHRLVEFADARDFMRGTQSRIEQAPNRDYANLLELQSFFGDHLRESINHMVQTALKDPAVKAGAQEYYIATSQAQAAAQTALIISKYRPDRLGLSEYFREQCLREIQRERNGLGDAVDIDSIIESFERVALSQDSSDPQLLQFSEQFRKKMGGIVGSHRVRTHEFLRELGYSQFEDNLLSQINIPELISNRNKLTVASADQKTLEDYFTELLHQQCSPRIDKLTKELQKFEPDSDSPVSAARRRVNCFITKNHTSAHARKTAGVCVSIDNPARVTV
jgi:hypothetical protein